MNGCGSVIPRAIVSRGSLPGYVDRARARAVYRVIPWNPPGITRDNPGLSASLRWWHIDAGCKNPDS